MHIDIVVMPIEHYRMMPIEHYLYIIGRFCLSVCDVFAYSFQMGFSWFQVGFHGFLWLQVGFSWFFMVPGGFSWFFMVPDWFS